MASAAVTPKAGVPTLWTLCAERLKDLLLAGKDLPDLGSVPSLLALELLRFAIVPASTSQGSPATAWACWLRHRPPRELHLVASLDMTPEARLRRFGPLGALRELHISGPALVLSDLDLEKGLAGAEHLQVLRLHDCPRLTGRFLRTFVGHCKGGGESSLRSLFCSACPGLLDSAMAYAAELPLLHLGVPGARQLTDATVAALSGGAGPAPLPTAAGHLVYLDLSQTSISDVGAELLARISGLEALLLSRTSRVSAATMRRLSGSLRLRAVMPDRPKVLVRSMATAAKLRETEHGSPPWGGAAEAALTAVAARVALAAPAPSDVDRWPEDAVRHAVAVLHCDGAQAEGLGGHAAKGGPEATLGAIAALRKRGLAPMAGDSQLHWAKAQRATVSDGHCDSRTWQRATEA
ncbi:unnamed protein product, partial [Polarella glacialis]